jgi:hypothetical protein
LVITKATFGSAAYTMVFEEGDTSKPYRHIPMFRPDVQAVLESGGFGGFSVQAVNLYREPERPLEQLPQSRKRFALALSLAHRFSESTLRLTERLYTDDWGLRASTTDARFMYDVLKDLRVWPHLRFHAQGGADRRRRTRRSRRSQTMGDHPRRRLHLHSFLGSPLREAAPRWLWGAGFRSRVRAMSARWIWVLVPLLVACGDPLRDRRIELLGDEDDGFPEDERHRPGQPCTWCHNSYEGARPEMAVAGTIFFRPPDGIPYTVGDFVVRILDSDGKTIELAVNPCGNFWATPEQFTPVYPIRTRILSQTAEGGLLVNVGMGTRIGRESSCGACHSEPKSPFSPGAVTVNAVDATNPPLPPDPTFCPPPRFAPQYNTFTF